MSAPKIYFNKKIYKTTSCFNSILNKYINRFNWKCVMSKKELEFKDILKEFLKEYSLTQTAFAKSIGVKQSQVSEWIKGKSKPGYDSLRSMVIAFGIPAEFFLGLESN